MAEKEKQLEKNAIEQEKKAAEAAETAKTAEEPVKKRGRKPAKKQEP